MSRLGGKAFVSSGCCWHGIELRAGRRARYADRRRRVGAALARLQGRRVGAARPQPHDRRGDLRGTVTDEHRLISRHRASSSSSPSRISSSTTPTLRSDSRRGFRERADGERHRRHSRQHARRPRARRREVSRRFASSAPGRSMRDGAQALTVKVELLGRTVDLTVPTKVTIDDERVAGQRRVRAEPCRSRHAAVQRDDGRAAGRREVVVLVPRRRLAATFAESAARLTAPAWAAAVSARRRRRLL